MFYKASVFPRNEQGEIMNDDNNDKGMEGSPCETFYCEAPSTKEAIDFFKETIDGAWINLNTTLAVRFEGFIDLELPKPPVIHYMMARTEGNWEIGTDGVHFNGIV